MTKDDRTEPDAEDAPGPAADEALASMPAFARDTSMSAQEDAAHGSVDERPGARGSAAPRGPAAEGEAGGDQEGWSRSPIEEGQDLHDLGGEPPTNTGGPA